MALFVRVDDFPGTKRDEFWRHNLDNFKMFDFYMKKHGLNYVLGVIPGYTMPADLQWLSEQDHIEIAMHGVVHDESHLDEFEGKTYRDVENAMAGAKNRLEATTGRWMKSYIPPHNAIGPDTVLVLSRLGFERVHGGPETDDDMKSFIRMSGMEYAHSEPPLEYGRSDELVERGAVDYLRAEIEKRDVWLTLHWPWEWNIGLSNLDAFLKRLCDKT